jgi:hypothetical protein
VGREENTEPEEVTRPPTQPVRNKLPNLEETVETRVLATWPHQPEGLLEYGAQTPAGLILISFPHSFVTCIAQTSKLWLSIHILFTIKA